MSAQTPFFSVIMPTYNRAHLLSSAVKSVLQQTFGDLELIISNGGSTDNTREVVKSFDDPRIRYFESSERLSIGDNYQNGLAHARGEFISFLSDDDAFVPTAFERVKRVLEEHQPEILTFRVSHYFHEADHGREMLISANSLEVPIFSSKVRKFSRNEALGLLYSDLGLGDGNQHPDFIVPYLANAVYRHDIFERVKKKKSHLFDTTPADMYLAAAVFFVINSYFCLNEPLHVWSSWSGNASASPSKQADNLRKHYEKLLNGRKLEYTPLKSVTPQNCAMNAVLEAKNDFDSNDEIEINWSSYFVKSYDSLNYLRNVGVNVEREFAEFNEFLSRQTAELQNQVHIKIDVIRQNQKSSVLSITKNYAKESLRKKLPFVFSALKKVFGKKNINSKCVVYDGDKLGFSDHLEAARYLNDKVLKNHSLDKI